MRTRSVMKEQKGRGNRRWLFAPVGTIYSSLLLVSVGSALHEPANTCLVRKGMNHGTTIFTRRFEGCGARNAQAQARHAQERQERKESHEPQAGDCHRTFRSAQQRQEGTAQKREISLSGERCETRDPGAACSCLDDLGLGSRSRPAV